MSGSAGVMPESPLDVLSRAASMVESGATSHSDHSDEGEGNEMQSPPSPRMICSSPPTGHLRVPLSIPSLKEIHPKFRKHSAPAEYLTKAETVRSQKLNRTISFNNSDLSSPSVTSTTAMYRTVPQISSPEEAPLDFSMRKRSSSPNPPPPYRYANPLRQHSPPMARSSQSPPLHPSHIPVNPAPAYTRYPSQNPPPYPRTPSPSPPPAPPSDIRPPPPSYEATIATKPSSPGLSTATTSPTFITLNPRPSPSQGSHCSSIDPVSTSPSGPRPSVICAALPNKQEGSDVMLRLGDVSSQENKESKEYYDRGGQRREVTIVEERGASDLMEEHFRKSLGDNYSKLFESDKKEDKDTSREVDTHMEVDPVKAFKDDPDMSGYTVEDHFKKALGESCWIQLQKDAEKKAKKPVVAKPKPQLMAL